jgi:hypothetical protein
MPRVGFIGTRVSTEDHERVDELLANGSGYSEQARRCLRYLVEFRQANLPEATSWSRARTLELFLAQMSRSHESFATTEGYATIIEKFQLDGAAPESGEERIRRFQLTNGLERAARMQGPLKVKEPTPLASLASLLTEQEPVDSKERDYQAFWFLMIATGARPDNLLKGGSEIEISNDVVRLRWTHRKERRGAHAYLRYPLTWSLPAPSWIPRRIAALGNEDWYFRNSNNIAGAVNAWLRSHFERNSARIRFTCKATRDRLSQLLLRLYESGEITKEKFEDLMDHQVTTAMRHYCHEI